MLVDNWLRMISLLAFGCRLFMPVILSMPFQSAWHFQVRWAVFQHEIFMPLLLRTDLLSFCTVCFLLCWRTKDEFIILLTNCALENSTVSGSDGQSRTSMRIDTWLMIRNCSKTYGVQAKFSYGRFQTLAGHWFERHISCEGLREICLLNMKDQFLTRAFIWQFILYHMPFLWIFVYASVSNAV